jgi:hypothetical protein
MKKTLFITLLAFAFNFKGKCQYVITKQSNDADLFYCLLPSNNPNDIFVYQMGGKNSLTDEYNQSAILKYNNYIFQEIRRIPSGFRLLGYPIKSDNYFYWPALYLDSTVINPTTQIVYVFKFDNNYNYISVKRISNGSLPPVVWPSTIARINNHFFVSVKNNNSNTSTIYKLDTLLNEISNVTINTNGSRVWQINPSSENNLILSAEAFPPVTQYAAFGQKVVLDTNLNIVSVFDLDSLGFVNPGCLQKIFINPFALRVIPITKHKQLILGDCPIIYNSSCKNKQGIVHSVIDNNNQILNTKLIIDSTQHTSYFDISNNVDIHKNYILSVGGQGFIYPMGFLQPVKTSILVCKLDTLGNLIWKKSYGKDMFYRPTSIIQAKDSSILIAGIRCDTATVQAGIPESFILKLDKNGNMLNVGVKDYLAKDFQSFKCYPNPSNSLIHFDIPLLDTYSVTVYDILGKKVYEASDYKNKSSIDVLNLNAGTYSYVLKTKNSVYNGKFIKE